MATSFTPGLRVAESVTIVKERKLPLRGDLVVKIGERVRFDQIVARTELPGAVYPVQVAHVLGIEATELATAMSKKEKDRVSQGEVIAGTSSFFGLFRNECHSPIEGFVESVSLRTGQVNLQKDPVPVEINAFMDGEIIALHEGEGVTVRTRGAYIQGIFGIGGEAFGPLKVVSPSPDHELGVADITADLAGKIIVGGSGITREAFFKARDLGVKAVIVGAFDNGHIREILGYELGVAITGSEAIGISLILTEGFGRIPITGRTWALLNRLDGLHASVNGATQIRAGVIRPEIVVPRPEGGLVEEKTATGDLSIGSEVRIIRVPWFGATAKVTALPPEPRVIESGAKVRVLEVELLSGERVTLPRANIELIQK